MHMSERLDRIIMIYEDGGGLNNLTGEAIDYLIEQAEENESLTENVKFLAKGYEDLKE